MEMFYKEIRTRPFYWFGFWKKFEKHKIFWKREMAYETIEFEIEEHVALITLNREEAANALNVQMADELMDAAIRCDTEKSVRAVLITARVKCFAQVGSQGFFRSWKWGGVLAKDHDLTPCCRFTFRQNGSSAGCSGQWHGRWWWAIFGPVADMVLSARSAKFTLAYTRAGLVPDGSSTYFLPRLLDFAGQRNWFLPTGFECGRSIRLAIDQSSPWWRTFAGWSVETGQITGGWSFSDSWNREAFACGNIQ